MTRAAFVLGSNGPEAFGRLKRLAFAETDAGRMAARLRRSDLQFTIAPRRRRSSTSKVIIDQFEKLAYELGPQDDLLFYFAGHGVVSHGDLFLVLNDTIRGRLTGTGLPWVNIKQIIRQSAARSKVVILDCCHAGEAIADPLGGAFRGGFDGESINTAVRGSTASILVACGPDGLARESGGLGGGLLTTLILQALGTNRIQAADGTGRVSLESLRDWMWEEIDRSQALAAIRNERPRLYSSGGPTFYLDPTRERTTSRTALSGVPLPPLPPRPNNLVTSRLGLQFQQGDQTIMAEAADDYVQVLRLARSPFVILLPRVMTARIEAEDLALQITLSDDPSLLQIARIATDRVDHTPETRLTALRRIISSDYDGAGLFFEYGTGMADHEHGSGCLFAIDICDPPYGHNYIVGNRFNVEQSNRRGFYVSAVTLIRHQPRRLTNLLPKAAAIYLVCRIDDRQNSKSTIDPLDLELIKIEMPP